MRDNAGRQRARGRRALLAVGLAVLPAVAFTGPAAYAAPSCPEFVAPADGEPKKQVSANMNGAQVVSSSGAVGVGDPDGTGTVVLGLQSTTNSTADISFQLQVSGGVALPLEGAHIHKGEAGATGVVIFPPLFTFSDQPDRSGVITVSKCAGHDIMQRPSNYYVDVHNQEYPDQGAVRGQLQDAR